MVRLILWLLVGVLIYRMWRRMRARKADPPLVRGPTVKRRRMEFDRSQIVDAEFHELDEDEKSQ